MVLWCWLGDFSTDLPEGQQGQHRQNSSGQLREGLGPRVIKALTFFDCLGLTTLIINYELEEIGVGAFNGCMSLVIITTPPFDRAIKDWAFIHCSGLMTAIITKWAGGDWGGGICQMQVPCTHRNPHSVRGIKNGVD